MSSTPPIDPKTTSTTHLPDSTEDPPEKQPEIDFEYDLDLLGINYDELYEKIAKNYPLDKDYLDEDPKYEPPISDFSQDLAIVSTVGPSFNQKAVKDCLYVRGAFQKDDTTGMQKRLAQLKKKENKNCALDKFVAQIGFWIALKPKDYKCDDPNAELNLVIRDYLIRLDVDKAIFETDVKYRKDKAIKEANEAEEKNKKMLKELQEKKEKTTTETTTDTNVKTTDETTTESTEETSVKTTEETTTESTEEISVKTTEEKTTESTDETSGEPLEDDDNNLMKKKLEDQLKKLGNMEFDLLKEDKSLPIDKLYKNQKEVLVSFIAPHPSTPYKVFGFKIRGVGDSESLEKRGDFLQELDTKFACISGLCGHPLIFDPDKNKISRHRFNKSQAELVKLMEGKEENKRKLQIFKQKEKNKVGEETAYLETTTESSSEIKSLFDKNPLDYKKRETDEIEKITETEITEKNDKVI